MADFKNKELIYDRDLITEFDKLDNENKKVLEWIKRDSSILEFGCHSGYLTYWFKEYNCSTVGVDIDEQALEKAKAYLNESYLGNIEKDEFWDVFRGRKFENITFLHILEHLVDPWTVLKKTRNILTDDGVLIISLPNICNAKNRFSILKGRFDYEDVGVMDRTHLRFFNIKTSIELIEQAGFKVVEYYSPVQVSPVRALFNELPVLHRLTKFMSPKPSKRTLFSNNLTDLVMTFKCIKD